MGCERIDGNFDNRLVLPETIVHIKAPTIPQFRFEWHPKIKKVYLIRVGAIPEIGEMFAHEIETEGAAWNSVLIFLRGYRTAKAEGALNVKAN
jgi:hypothetical protein